VNWLFLSLLCAFSLASADAFTKKWLADYNAQELVLIRFAWTGLVLAPFLLIAPFPQVPWAFWGWVGAMIPIEILAMFFYMQAIRESPLALTLPYLAFTPAFATLTGFLLLGEQVSWDGFGGILLVVIGAYLLNLKLRRGQDWRAWLAPFYAIMRERGSRLMLMVAVLYSLTSVLGKGALEYMSPKLFGPFYYVLLGLITLGFFALQKGGNVHVLWRRPRQHFFVALMMGAMLLTHFTAIAQVEVAYMISVKRTSLLFGIVYGAVLFSERRLGVHLLAGTLMVIGVALIAFSSQ
jgi:drug/metabolite transporter (DMT)-like permease